MPSAPDAGPREPRSTAATPTFAIVVPTFNDSPALRETITSALQQTVAPTEVIVVDDCSTSIDDDTLDSLASMGVTVVRRDQNGGPAAARNSGAREATATWLVFLDADSLLAPDALENLRGAINGGTGLVRAPYSWLESPSSSVCGFLPGTFAVRRAVFDEIGGYDEALRFAENTELEWRIATHLGRHGLAAASSERPTVTLRSVGNARNYDVDRMRAAMLILEKHSERFSLDHRERARYEAIVSVNAMRTEQWAIARHYALMAARSEPCNPRHLTRALVSLTGRVGGQWLVRRTT